MYGIKMVVIGNPKMFFLFMCSCVCSVHVCSFCRLTINFQKNFSLEFKWSHLEQFNMCVYNYNVIYAPKNLKESTRECQQWLIQFFILQFRLKRITLIHIPFCFVYFLVFSIIQQKKRSSYFMGFIEYISQLQCVANK